MSRSSTRKAGSWKRFQTWPRSSSWMQEDPCPLEVAGTRHAAAGELGVGRHEVLFEKDGAAVGAPEGEDLLGPAPVPIDGDALAAQLVRRQVDVAHIVDGRLRGQ